MNTTSQNTTTTTQEQDVASLTDAIVQHAAGTLDTSGLQAVYRDVHASRRGNVQSAAIIAAMGVEGFDLAAVLDAFANLPTVTSRVAARQVTDAEANLVRAFLRRTIARNIDAWLTTDIVVGDEENPFNDEFLAQVLIDAGERAMAAIDRQNIGTSRTTHDDEPTDYVPAGTVLKGTYKGNTVTVTLNADNKVTMAGVDEPLSLSAAAKLVVGRAQNGWAFWRTPDGATLASLRQS